MLHLVMPSMSDGLSPASSSASFAASSAVTSSGRPMFLENGSWPMPTMAARSLSDTGLPRRALPSGALAGVVEDQLEVAVERGGGVLADGVERRQEDAETHAI